MSTSEILSELPKLNARDRRLVFERLCELQDQDLCSGLSPSQEEKELLDRALADYEQDKDPGRPWRDVLKEIRQSSAR